jgi:3-hydroxyacyl-[acyl-carrier-protein] dehydratase
MRWFWIDRFLEFERGKRAVAIKAVALTEEEIDDYCPGLPHLSNPLIVEGMAQTGGLLAGEYYQFKERVVLAKIGKVVFHCPAMPGDVLRYTAEIQDIKPDGCILHCTSHIGDRLQADVEMVLAHLDDARFKGVDLFEPGEFLRLMRLYGVYIVGRDEQGRPLVPPEHMLAAEAKMDADAPPAG